MQKITPHLWFASHAEEAAKFYATVFDGSKLGQVIRYTETGQEIHGQPPGSVMTVEFQLEGMSFIALNGGPHFKFNPSTSFMVNCSDKEEVDKLWSKLSESGKVLMPVDSYPFSARYGWLEDKYGLSWQLIATDQKIQQKIVPSLMFVGLNCGRAKEAVDFYLSTFKNSKSGTLSYYGPGQEPDQEGTLMFGDFMLENIIFSAMDSAHDHKFNFNEAVSFLISCNDQDEIDYYWNQLSAIPEAEQCGWLKDQFGVSWQVVPTVLNDMLTSPDPKKSATAMEALLNMKKIEIDALAKAHDQAS